MQAPLYSSAGEKVGTVELPAALFEAPVRRSLMHQALLRQQANRRQPVAHVKTRGEVRGSTRKLYAQKHTGRARRGAVRSPLLRGGGKTFGPRNTRNPSADMPKKMRRAALFSCLSFQAKRGLIVGLQEYPDRIKTKDFVQFLAKLPVKSGRPILFVMAEKHRGLTLSSRNVPRLKVISAPYLNPEDILRSYHIVFLVDALKKAEEIFGKQPKQSASS